MAAYLIGQVTVHDQERFAPYVERTSVLIARYGGEVLDVVRAIEVVEGEWLIGALTDLVRFPDEASLRASALRSRLWLAAQSAAPALVRHLTVHRRQSASTTASQPIAFDDIGLAHPSLIILS
jgi:uncharacterized protein (DUF1330 family)